MLVTTMCTGTTCRRQDGLMVVRCVVVVSLLAHVPLSAQFGGGTPAGAGGTAGTPLSGTRARAPRARAAPGFCPSARRTSRRGPPCSGLRSLARGLATPFPGSGPSRSTSWSAGASRKPGVTSMALAGARPSSRPWSRPSLAGRAGRPSSGSGPWWVKRTSLPTPARLAGGTGFAGSRSSWRV